MPGVNNGQIGHNAVPANLSTFNSINSIRENAKTGQPAPVFFQTAMAHLSAEYMRVHHNLPASVPESLLRELWPTATIYNGLLKSYVTRINADNVDAVVECLIDSSLDWVQTIYDTRLGRFRLMTPARWGQYVYRKVDEGAKRRYRRDANLTLSVEALGSFHWVLDDVTQHWTSLQLTQHESSWRDLLDNVQAMHGQIPELRKILNMTAGGDR